LANTASNFSAWRAVRAAAEDLFAVPPLAIHGLVLVDVVAQRAPSSEMPAKMPRERDQEGISAVIKASVWAVASRPTGPAAAVASAPMVTGWW